MRLSSQDYWHAIVLYGASARHLQDRSGALLDGATPEHGKTQVSKNELAQAFFQEYCQRLANGLPQQTNPARKTVLERAVEAFERGDLRETAAIDLVERQGFSDVVPRFHTVNRDPIPLRLYEATSTALVLTDDLLATVAGSSQEALRAEALSRWDLLDAAFAMHLPVEVLGTDEHMLYRTTGYERINFTGTYPVPSGYQNGLCFYCEEPIAGELVHVDHVIPRTFLNHDEIWNLVLAHNRCNLEKSARLPSRNDREQTQ